MEPPLIEGAERGTAGISPRPRRRAVVLRLLTSFLAVMLAFAITVGYGVVAQRRAARDSELLRSGYMPLLLSLQAALENQNLVNAQLNHITEAKNPADARLWIETARRLRPRMFNDVRIAVERGVMPSTDDRARLLGAEIVRDSKDLETFLAGNDARLAELFAALEAQNGAKAQTLRDASVAHEIAGARRVRELKARVEAEMDRLIAAARDRERRALESLLALAALTLAVGIAMTLYARRVLKPLAAVTERAHAVAAGDMTPRPVMEVRDEIGELAETFESMVAAIAKANEARLQAERLAAVGRMAAHVTHEIRNPLSSIGLNLELLDEEMSAPDATESRQLLQAIRREVDHLSSLSNEYLSLARPQEPRFEAESLADLVREATSFVRLELAKANVELSLDLPDDVPDAMTDESQVRQALANLVRNAREAMPKGGVLSIVLRRDGDDHVSLTVQDTGSGIPDEIRKSVFDPFFTTKNRGTGLGLAITRQIIESHGGSITCDAVEPHGTCFRIRLRSAEADDR